MDRAVPARLSREEARRFGLAVGAVFLLLAALMGWRGRALPAQVLGGLGGALVVAGAIAPALLSPVFRVWMRLALALSRVTTPVLMAVVYFGLITPIGAIRRLLGHDSLATRPKGGGFWVARTDSERQRSDMGHQF